MMTPLLAHESVNGSAKIYPVVFDENIIRTMASKFFVQVGITNVMENLG